MTVDTAIRDVLPWFMSAITLYMTFLQGSKRWDAWAWGLVNQLLWLVYVLYTHTWGLLPLNIGLWFLYVRNLRRWHHEESVFVQAAREGAQEYGMTDMRRLYQTTVKMKRSR